MVVAGDVTAPSDRDGRKYFGYIPRGPAIQSPAEQPTLSRDTMVTAEDRGVRLDSITTFRHPCWRS